MQRLIMATAMLLALALGLFGVQAASAQGDPTCADFDTYDAAYTAFEEAGGPEQDPFDLDPDRDGYPCEEIADAPDQAMTAPENAWGGTDAEESSEPSARPTREASETPEPTETPDATGGITTDTMPTSGVGSTVSNPTSVMTIMLALAAVAAAALGTTSLLRSRRS